MTNFSDTWAEAGSPSTRAETEIVSNANPALDMRPSASRRVILEMSIADSSQIVGSKHVKVMTHHNSAGVVTLHLIEQRLLGIRQPLATGIGPMIKNEQTRLGTCSECRELSRRRVISSPVGLAIPRDP